MNIIQSICISQSIALLAERLETIAIRKILVEAKIHNVALTSLEIFVHLVFNDLLYIFYPGYMQFYHEKQVEVFTAIGKIPPMYVNSALKEGVLFLHRFIASPTSIGSVFPSSKSLVCAMTRKVSEGVTAATPPRKYADIGGGTGSFSEGIIAIMRDQDSLDIIEYDESLAKLLQRRFHHLPNVHVHNVSIFEFHPGYLYDAIVTGLPLNNFPSEQVVQAFNKFEALTKPTGSYSYFEYMLFPTIGQKLRQISAHTESFENAKRIQQVKDEVQQKFATEIDSVYWNMTPARAIHCTV